jgi:valyl-tRNA synthetase
MFGWRKFCNKIYQAAKYILASLGTDFAPRATATKTDQESLAEKWILHKLTISASEMNDALSKRAFGRCTTILHHFWVHDLCDTFIVRYR